MGSMVRLLTIGAEHTVKQANIDAARLTQGAHNRAEMTIAEAQKIVQAANNAAADTNAASRRMVQGANNSASDAIAAGRKRLQVEGNKDSALLTGAKRTQQGTYNEQSILVTEAKRTLQAARNDRAAADSTLGLWSQSLKNSQKLDVAGLKVGQIAEDVAHGLDAALVGRVRDRLQASSVLGATIAQAAAAGVGGGSVEAYKNALRISQEFKEADQDQEVTSKVINAYRERGNVMASAVQSLDHSVIRPELDRSHLIADQNNEYVGDNQDYSPIFAAHDYTPINAEHDFTVFTPNIDYTQYVDDHKMSFLQQYLTFQAAGVATYFGGPQAGNAVIDASLGLHDAQNGDLAGAQHGFSSAFKGAVNGFNTYRAGANANQSGQAWGAQFWNPGSSGSNDPLWGIH